MHTHKLFAALHDEASCRKIRGNEPKKLSWARCDRFIFISRSFLSLIISVQFQSIDTVLFSSSWLGWVLSVLCYGNIGVFVEMEARHRKHSKQIKLNQANSALLNRRKAAAYRTLQRRHFPTRHCMWRAHCAVFPCFRRSHRFTVNRLT